MANIYDLTKVLAQVKVIYREEFKRAREERDKAIKYFNDEYKAGSQEKRVKIAEAEEKFKKTIDELRDTCKGKYKMLVEELETRARARVGIVNKELMDKVRAFADIPLSKDEFAAILSQFGGVNYLTDRLLEKMAEENGITSNGLTVDGEPLAIEPPLSTKLQILSELREQADHLIETYGTVDENMMSRTGDLFPDVLERAEIMYTNGLHETNISPKQIAVRVADILRTRGGSASNYLDNVLANATPAVQRAIMNEVLSHESGTIQAAIDRSKNRIKIHAFADGEMVQYRAAEKEMNTVYANLDEKEKVDAIIEANKANPYFIEMYQADAHLNGRLIEGLGHIFVQE